MIDILIFFLFSQTIFADVCSDKSYTCKYNSKEYVILNCSGMFAAEAFCTKARSSSMSECAANDGKVETDICNKEWSKSQTIENKERPVIENLNVTRNQVVETLGKCEYEKNEPKLIEIKTKECGAKKYICTFRATCKMGKLASGQCFSESTNCPADPIDCIAKRDLVAIGAGKEIIANPSLMRSDQSTAPGAIR